MDERYWKRSVCPYDCPDSCGLIMETDGKTIYKVKGDPDHPITKGYVCRKMQNFQDTIHHPNRILTPMKRTGAKGKGEFEPISWDEAIETITTQWKRIIDEYGSEAILPYSYAGNMHLIQDKCGEAFFHRLGASKLERTICSKAKTAGFAQMIGTTSGIDPDEIAYSDMIIIWGANIHATMLHAHEAILKAKSHGARVVLIETYCSPSVKLADEVILVKPGTDGSLALAMCYELKKQHLVDEHFIKHHTKGTRRFLDSLWHHKPANAQRITGVDAKTIKALAKTYGQAKAPLIIYGSGFSRHGNGAVTTRCITALPALTGAFFKTGGGIVGNISVKPAFDVEAITRPDFLKKSVRTINMNQIGSALIGDAVDAMGAKIGTLDPPIKSLYVYNSNPVDIAPAQLKVINGLLREDLFTVVHERFMTDTARFADILLPADTCAEHYNIATPYGTHVSELTSPVIAPVGESKSNWDTFCLLAKAMGFEERYFSLSNKEIIEDLLKLPNPIRASWDAATAQAFAEGKPVVIKPSKYKIGTPSGKIEFDLTGITPALPSYVENYGGKEALRLIVAPSVYTLNSTFTERKELIDARGRSVLKINTKDAYARGIADGNIIEAFNQLACVEFFADVTDGVPEGVAVAEGVYSLDESLSHLTVNALLSERLTDYGRASTLCDNTIDIRKL